MFTVVGSGFGLYGYLPALVEAFGDPVLLPQASRERIEARAEVAPYLDRVRWKQTREEALAEATGVVVATLPSLQPGIVRQCLGSGRIASLVLEKPLAVTPAEAIALLDDVRRAKKRCRIGYTLLHADWAPRLAWPERGDLSIEWTFLAHHFARGLDNWKARHADGGGALRFYGVHVIALLAQRGYREVAGSVLRGADPAKPEEWQAVFSGPRLPPCRVRIDSRSLAPRFRIGTSDAALVDLREPFEREPPLGPADADRRVGVLARLLATLRSDDAPYDALHDAACALWEATESATRFEARAA
jgi:hypothetical protein